MDYLDINTRFGSVPGKTPHLSAEELVNALKSEHVAQAVTLSMTGACLEAERGNSETLETCQRHRELLPAATVDPRNYFGKGDVILNAAQQGFVLLRLFNRLQNWPLDFSPLEVVFQEASEAGLPVMLDAIGHGDITRACQLSAVTETPVVLVGVDKSKLSEAIVCMTEYPTIYLETSAVNTPDALRLLCDEVGAERLLYGSATGPGCAPEACLALTNSGLSDDELRHVGLLNALKLLGIS